MPQPASAPPRFPAADWMGARSGPAQRRAMDLPRLDTVLAGNQTVHGGPRQTRN